MANQRQLNGGKQGSGSGLDADTTDGKEAANLGNTIDGITINKNVDGDIQVNSPRIEVLGDFEDDASGSWTGTGFVNGGASDGAESTDYYLDHNENTLGSIKYSERSINFDDIDTLIFYIKGDPREDGSTSGDFRFKIGGTIEYNDTGKDNASWVKVEVDTSTYSGSQTVRFEHENNNDTVYQNVGLDRVKVVRWTDVGGNGAGGT